MRTRDYKTFNSGISYHTYNRGNNKENIFLDDQDYFNFLKRLKLVLGLKTAIKNPNRIRISPLPDNSFDIFCYCLMPNHFHFLIKQNSLVSIDKLISRVCTSYSKYFNAKYNRVGHVFQGAFKAKPVEQDSYLTTLSAYIHTNPKNYLEYQYSSLLDYLNHRNGEICNKNFLLSFFNKDPQNYKNFVDSYDENQKHKISHLVFDD